MNDYDLLCLKEQGLRIEIIIFTPKINLPRGFPERLAFLKQFSGWFLLYCSQKTKEIVFIKFSGVLLFVHKNYFDILLFLLIFFDSSEFFNQFSCKTILFHITIK